MNIFFIVRIFCRLEGKVDSQCHGTQHRITVTVAFGGAEIRVTGVDHFGIVVVAVFEHGRIGP